MSQKWPRYGPIFDRWFCLVCLIIGTPWSTQFGKNIELNRTRIFSFFIESDDANFYSLKPWLSRLIKNITGMMQLLQAFMIGVPWTNFGKRNGSVTIDRKWISSFYIGGGYSQPIGQRGFAQVMILFELIQDPWYPYYRSNPIIRIGFGFWFCSGIYIPYGVWSWAE